MKLSPRMVSRTIAGIRGVILVATLLPDLLGAQGMRSDYERRDRLRDLVRDKVLIPRVEPHWSGDGNRFWYRRQAGDGRTEYVLVDAEKGTRSVALDRRKLADDLGETMASPSFLKQARPSRGGGEEIHVIFRNRTDSVVELLWSDLGGERKSYGLLQPGQARTQHTFQRHVWIFREQRSGKIAAYEARHDGEEVLLEADRFRKEEKPRGAKPSGRSPDGKRVVEVRGRDIFLDGVRLTTGGSEEFGFHGPVHWSPDSAKFVVMKRRQPRERVIHFVESSPKDGLQPKLHSLDYAKPGDEIAVSKPHLFDLTGDTAREIPLADDLFPNPWSITDLQWLPDSSEFVFLYNQRGHQVLRIIAVDAVNGRSRTVIEETSRTFIDYAGKKFARHLGGAGEWIWMSERDGWNHLYLYDHAAARVKTQITKGEWAVRGIDYVDVEKRRIWFRAGGIHPGQDPYQVHFCRVDFDGANLVVLTDGDGTHSVEYSPNRRYLIATHSRVDLPPVVELRRSADGGKVCELERADWGALLETGWRAPERFVAKGRDGQTDIHGVIFRSTRFDPNRSYPVIEKIYAGPHGSFVPREFRPYHQTQALAELGFIVVQIDGMGTSHRSKAFHDVAWKNLKDSGFPDRIRWMKAAAAKYPAMDLSRVGIFGGSAGGQSTVAALLWHGDFYKAGVADCGCHDNRVDKIWWNELWMGWPVDASYVANSNVVNARRLSGKLLLTVGEMDRNVDPASTMQLVDALIKADKDFDLIVVPGAGHGVGETPYMKRRRADFFVRHLHGVEPRRR